jgi:hypothetical protein
MIPSLCSSSCRSVTPIVGLIAVQNVLALPVGAGRRVGDVEFWSGATTIPAM